MKHLAPGLVLTLLAGAVGTTAYLSAHSGKDFPDIAAASGQCRASATHSSAVVTMQPQDEDTAQPALMAEVPIERMIGQMIVTGLVGTDASDPGVVAVRKQLENGVIGGVLLFEHNVRSPQQVRALNDSIRSAGGDTVPLIALDQEGGAVQRLTPSSGYVGFPSPAQVAAGIGPDPGGRALSLYRDMAAELKAAGFNVNFGPLVDLNTNPDNPIIGSIGRSFGADPGEVRKYAGIFNLAHQQANILTAAKHFPGHGSSRTDSHAGFTDISASWHPRELDPFLDLADDIDMVMIGHLYHPRFSDGPGIPASLSMRAVRSLRNDIGFKGVIVSDDMEMGALRTFSFADRVVRAIAAGTDLLIFANRVAPADDLGLRVHKAILCAVRSGTIARSRVERAYQRILRMKRTLVTPGEAAPT
jgi:beta-N-acetylhexosaminidase